MVVPSPQTTDLAPLFVEGSPNMIKIEVSTASRSVIVHRICVAMAMLLSVTANQSWAVGASPQDELLKLQQRLATETQGCVRMTLSMWGGIAVAKLPPISLTTAWHKPLFYYMHTSAWGENPEAWYWLERGQLQIFESWPAKKGSPGRAHGVRVANYAKVVDGEPEAAFRFAKDKIRAFVYAGQIGQDFLGVFQQANLKAMKIETNGANWIMKQKAIEFKSQFVKDNLTSDKQAAFVVFEVARTAQPLRSISVYPDLTRQPHFSETARFDEIGFSFDRSKLAFPSTKGAMKTVEVKKKTNVDGDLLWAAPFIKVESDTSQDAPIPNAHH